MENAEEIREFEETFLNAIVDAENGHEEKGKFLAEMSIDALAAVCNNCRPEIVLRLGEYYCLSAKTQDKGYAICERMKDNLDQYESSCSEGVVQNIKRFCTFEHLMGYVISNLGNAGKTGMVENLQNAITDICAQAEDGYVLAQYWMGWFAEHNIDFGNVDKPVLDCMTRAEKYYRQAADQGCVPAQKALKEIPTKQEQKCRERRLAGKCQHCGGSFKGIFKKVCSSCGKPKDY